MPAAPISLSALQAGDETAWRSAFRLLWPVAIRAARDPRLALSPEEVEEVANEALAQLVAKTRQLTRVEELAPLLATIAFRRAVSTSRHKFARKRRAVPVPLAEAEGAANPPDPPDLTLAGALTEPELAELTALLQRAFAALDGQSRLLLREKVVDGLSYRELSEKHRLPPGTVAAKVSRALAKVRADLKASPDLLKELRSLLR